MFCEYYLRRKGWWFGWRTDNNRSGTQKIQRKADKSSAHLVQAGDDIFSVVEKLQHQLVNYKREVEVECFYSAPGWRSKHEASEEQKIHMYSKCTVVHKFNDERWRETGRKFTWQTKK
jgi:hypothetical protein